MVIRKRVEGEARYNDGKFAEVMTIGIEGIEKDLLLEMIQIHWCDTRDTPEEFQQGFPVGIEHHDEHRDHRRSDGQNEAKG